MRLFVNLITTTRFLYSLFLPIIKDYTSAMFFLGNVVILFLTDSLDGYLARKYKVQTFYGALMDTVADKTLNIILLVCLLSSCPILWLVLVGELSIFLINTVAFLQGKKTKASTFGKAKMWFVAFSVIFGYLYFFDWMPMIFVSGIAIITFLSQLIAIFDYLRNLSSKRSQKWEKGERKDWKKVLFSTEYYLKNKI